MNHGELIELGAGVRALQGRSREPVALELGIQRLLERSHTRRSRRRFAVWGIGSLVAVTAVAFGIRAVGPQGSKLGFTVGSSTDVSFESRWVWAQSTEAVPVRFLDGTTVELEPDTRARVADLQRHAASLTLETGAVRARLVPHEGEWSIAAGPYEIRGSDSEFDVAWDPDAGVLDVEVQRGSASVDGPYLPNEQVVTLAQRLTVALRKKQVTISALGATGQLDTPTVDEPAFDLVDSAYPRTSDRARLAPGVVR